MELCDGRSQNRRGIMAALVLLAPLGAAEAQEAGGGASVSMGSSYSSLRGGLAFLTFDAEDLLGSGIDAQLRYEGGEDGNAGRLRMGKTFALGETRFGLESYLRGSVEGSESDWDSDEYALSRVRADLRFGAEMAPNLGYEFRLFWSDDDLKRFASDASPLVVAERGRSTSAGVALNLGWSTLDTPVLPTMGERLILDMAVATPLGDREWVSVAASGGIARPIGQRAVMSFVAEAGAIEGLDGQTVGIVDRAFAGNPMPRGFAGGGIGPRDHVSGSTDTSLGGNRYVTASAEIRFKTANPLFQIGTFIDAGSVWSLDRTAGGASGTIDDGFSLRASAGISIYWNSPLGLLQASFAAPIHKEPHDVEENVSLGLSVRF